jgi:hypothetical protein
MFNGRRQPSRGGTSRMMREYQVRFCERLGVQFPGPTRHGEKNPTRAYVVRSTSVNGPSGGEADGLLSAMSRLSGCGPGGMIRACAAFSEYASFQSVVGPVENAL